MTEHMNTHPAVELGGMTVDEKLEYARDGIGHGNAPYNPHALAALRAAEELAVQLRRVRALLAQWDGPEGWTDVETNERRYENGYRTCWRERSVELHEALDPAEQGPETS